MIDTLVQTVEVKLNQSECNTLSVPLTSSQSNYVSESLQLLILFLVLGQTKTDLTEGSSLTHKKVDR